MTRVENRSPDSPLRQGRLRTVLSFGIAIAGLIYVAFNLDFAQVWRGIQAADWRWYLLGFGLFYLSLPLRALRWRVLLANVGDHVGLGRLMRTIFRAWFVNCALPGRTGDLYSAYLLREEEGLSLVKIGGTIFTARALDLITLIALMAYIFLARFRSALPGVFGNLVYTALVLAGVLIVGLVVLGLMRERVARLLPERFETYFRNFTTGLFGSLSKLPVVILLTLSLWILEAARLGCVLAAVGALVAADKVIILALTAAVVTTLPLTPGGLGTVEALFTEMFPRMGIPAALSGSAIFLDRFINYWFILLAGLVYFVATRGRG
jgi:uncharacterized protein (TIRG00374 family)